MQFTLRRKSKVVNLLKNTNCETLTMLGKNSLALIGDSRSSDKLNTNR